MFISLKFHILFIDMIFMFYFFILIFQLEQGPSTMHRDHKRNSQKNLNDPSTNDKSKIKNSFSDETCLHNNNYNTNNNKQDSLRKRQQQQQQTSPYSKSVDSLKDKRKEIYQEISAFRKQYHSSPRSPNFSPELLSTTTTTTSTTNNSNNNNKNKPKNESTDRMKASSKAAAAGSKESVVMISPRKTKSLSPNLRYQKSDSRSNVLKTPPSYTTISSTTIEDNHKQQQYRVADKTRSGMMAVTVPTKSRTDKMDLEHQRLMRAKKIASEALKVI